MSLKLSYRRWFYAAEPIEPRYNRHQWKPGMESPALDDIPRSRRYNPLRCTHAQSLQGRGYVM